MHFRFSTTLCLSYPPTLTPKLERFFRGFKGKQGKMFTFPREKLPEPNNGKASPWKSEHFFFFIRLLWKMRYTKVPLIFVIATNTTYVLAKSLVLILSKTL